MPQGMRGVRFHNASLAQIFGHQTLDGADTQRGSGRERAQKEIWRSSLLPWGWAGYEA
jgi:hypothetical protein